MRNIARLSDNDRRELFRNTADKMGLNDAIVEKDFWVCFTLDYLFHRSPWKESITFKGGTSLSKAFHLISRFSEDIDLILDWRVLGYGKDEPWEKRSNTKQDAFNKEANARAEVFLGHFDWRKLFYPVAECTPVYAIFTFQLWIRGSSGIVEIHDLLLKFRSVGFLVFRHVEHLLCSFI